MIKDIIRYTWGLRPNWLPIPWRMAHGSWMLLYNDRQSLARLKDYEPKVWRFIKSLDLLPGSLCLDIGANDGYFTLLLAKLDYKVVAFEPVPENQRRLQENLKLNGIRNVLIVGAAVGACTSSRKEFYVADKNLSRSSLAIPVEEGQYNYKPIFVDQIALDSWSRNKIDFIKIDAEGAELEILKGAKRILTEDRPTIVIEVADIATRQFGYAASEILDLLKTYDYEILPLRNSPNPEEVRLGHYRGEVAAIPN